MGRFDPVYSQEQRDAIVKAICDDGMTAPAAVRHAAQHGLYGLEPFDFKLGTARHYAGEERRRRRSTDHAAARQGTPEQRIDAQVKDHLAMIEREGERLDLKSRSTKGKGLDPADIEKARKLASWLREIRGVARGIPTAAGGTRQRRQDQAKTHAATPPSNDLTAQLLHELQGAAKQDTDSGDQPPNQNGHEETSAVPAHVPAPS